MHTPTGGTAAAVQAPPKFDASMLECFLQASSSHGVVVFDGDLRITHQGSGVTTLLGWAPGALVGRPLDHLLHGAGGDHLPVQRSGPPGDTPRRLRTLPQPPTVTLATVRSGGLDGAWSLSTATGAAHPAEVRCSLAADGGHGPSGGVLVATDLSATVGAKQQLSDSEEQFRLVFEKAPTAMAVVSLSPATHGRIRRANTAMQSFTGRRLRELFSMSITQLLDETHRDEHPVHLGSNTAGTPEAPDEAIRRFTHRDGSIRLARQSTALVTPAGAGEPHLLVQLQDVTAQHAAQQELAHAALHDPLTGLANRVLFNDRLQHALAAEARARRGLTLLYVDLDDFKPVNDTHGHAAGDAVLVHVSARLQSAVRDEDTVARLGGDEFAVICPGLAAADVATVIARIHRELAEPAVLSSTVALPLAASIGSATVVGAAHAEEVLQAADAAMYAAKKTRPASATARG